MLHILLLILKIIGIVLLCLLGVLVLGIVCALFVPVRYRVEAVRREGEGEPPVILRVKVTWLLHFVNLIVRFDGNLFVRARIMLFTLFRLPKKEKRKKKGGRKEKSGAEPEKAGAIEAARENNEKNAADEHSGKDDGVKAAQEKRESAAQTDLSEETENRPNGSIKATETEGEDEPSEKPSFMDKLRAIPKILRGIFYKIKGLFENIQYTIQKFCDKIKSASDTIAYYRGVIEGEPFQHSFALCKGELMRVGKSLKPQKFEAQLIVGMDDPAVTGQILGYFGMLYPLIGGHVDVAGDFEKKRLEGRVFLKGKIRFFTFLRAAVKVYFNKDIRKLYRILKKGGSVNG